MAITATTLQTYLEAAITALAASDYATARNSLAQAQLAVLGLPNAGSDGERVEWQYKFDHAKKLIDDAEAAESAAETGNRIARAVPRFRR